MKYQSEWRLIFGKGYGQFRCTCFFGLSSATFFGFGVSELTVRNAANEGHCFREVVYKLFSVSILTAGVEQLLRRYRCVFIYFCSDVCFWVTTVQFLDGVSENVALSSLWQSFCFIYCSKDHWLPFKSLLEQMGSWNLKKGLHRTEVQECFFLYFFLCTLGFFF